MPTATIRNTMRWRKARSIFSFGGATLIKRDSGLRRSTILKFVPEQASCFSKLRPAVVRNKAKNVTRLRSQLLDKPESVSG